MDIISSGRARLAPSSVRELSQSVRELCWQSVRGLSPVPAGQLTVHPRPATLQGSSVCTPFFVGEGSYLVPAQSVASKADQGVNVNAVCGMDVTDSKFSTRLGPSPDSPPV
jgi:hypothetical protein